MNRSVTKKPKLTKWFEPHMKPFRKGYYQTGIGILNPIELGEYAISEWYWYWDGDFWLEKKNGHKTILQERFWRGLAQKPEVQP